MSFDENVWKDAIRTCVPEKFLELNLKAFDLGKISNKGAADL